MRKFCALLLLLLLRSAFAEEITVGTYNIELFDRHFLAHHFANKPIAQDPDGKELLEELRKKNDEDNWETAQVILDPKFNPDVLVIEEGCDQADLEYFNHRWLNDAFEIVRQFPSNTQRHQQVEVLIKKGFKILEQRDQYYLEPDSVGNDRGSRLFARGPVFLKLRTPGNYIFWLGLTHMKSKSVGTLATTAGATKGKDGKDSPEVHEKKLADTKWRNREAVRTHQIIKDLEKTGPSDVLFLGDMNDSIGLDAYEPEAGGDAIANLVGSPEDGLLLVTKPLADAGQNSFHGYWRTGFRELIDHVIVTRSMKDQVLDVKIITNGLASVASDHFPVLVRIKSDPPDQSPSK